VRGLNRHAFEGKVGLRCEIWVTVERKNEARLPRRQGLRRVLGVRENVESRPENSPMFIGKTGER